MPDLTLPKRTVIAGVDPGASGALAFLDTIDWSLELFDMPHKHVVVNNKKRKHVDKEALADIFNTRPILLISTEKVHAMPDMHAASVFSFGRYYGQIEMASILIGADYLETDPSRWKAQMGYSSDKDLSRQRTGLLIPAVKQFLTRKTDHDRAEACALALWGAFHLGLSPRNITLKSGPNANRKVA